MCGIAGAFNIDNAEHYIHNMLFAIQHRGQESCGIATRTDRDTIVAYKNMGLVKNVLTQDILDQYSGRAAIGHVRYPTAGCSDLVNAQPFAIELAEGPHMALCGNGDIINYQEVRDRLTREYGFSFKSDNDGELIGRLIACHHIIDKTSLEEAIQLAQEELKGAYSTILMYKNKMFAFRDPHGLRPFVMGHIEHEGRENIPSDGTVFASESSAFGIVGAKRVREVRPGEILRLEGGKEIDRKSVV